MQEILLLMIYAENEANTDYAQRRRGKRRELDDENCVYGARHKGDVPGDGL